MLIRIRIILQHLTNGQRVTAGHMARVLDVSQRTIARDFDYMINGLDLPIKYEFGRKSYILDGPLPSIFAVSAPSDGAIDGKGAPTKQHPVRERVATASAKRGLRKNGAK